jgi:hypothetical protein
MQEYILRPKDKLKPYIKALMNKLKEIDMLKLLVTMGDEDYIDAGMPIDQRIRFQKVSFNKAPWDFSRFIKAIVRGKIYKL